MPESVKEETPDSRHRSWVLAVAAAGVLLATIDASIVNIALPTIGDYFEISVKSTAWVTISYLLTVTAFLLIFGRLSDAYGQKLVFISGMAIFTAGSGLCAISGSIVHLIAFRLLQGLGAAMIMSNTPAIVTNAFPSKGRGMALGIIGAVVSIGMMLGPPLGGILIHYYGWQYIFVVNIPVGILAILFSLRVLREFRADPGEAPFRALDAALWIASILVFVLIFGIAGSADFSAENAIILSIIALIFFVVFFTRQWKSDLPLFNTDLLRNSIFVFSSGAGFFTYMSMMGLSFMLPFLLEKTFLLPPLQTGRVLMVVPATTVFASPLAGYISDKIGQRPVSTAGLALVFASTVYFLRLDADASLFRIISNLVAFGLGLGFFGSPNNSALMGSVDQKNRGSAAGILATVRNLGMVSGVSIVSLIFNSALLRDTADEAIRYSGAFKSALPAVLVLQAVAIISSSLRRSV